MSLKALHFGRQLLESKVDNGRYTIQDIILVSIAVVESFTMPIANEFGIVVLFRLQRISDVCMHAEPKCMPTVKQVIC